ncbi:hypothetical protein [Paracoccus chinensis]|uniref:Uncharacterized protein n=1 Tax=Paracoccus chinensis TaxID=525640 RepID=A0A1G9JFI1_9RHOB|nr:hypothetical protein [Paracoccus chinensis]SDL36330.1 hypothetical protein SAMN04487971_109116 [Paracoccus chinensis]
MTSLTYEQQVAIARRLQKIARLIDKELTAAAGQRVPFSLYTWGGNRSQYISNTARAEVKVAMQETLDRWNEPQDPPPGQGGWQ